MAQHFCPAQAWHGPAATGLGPAQLKAPGRDWAATVAHGTAQARPDGPVVNGLVRNIAC